MEGAPLPGPGWFPDPADPNTLRYWDGQQWTDNRTPAHGAVPGGAAGVKTNGMAIASLVLGLLWGYGVLSILAIIFAVVGKNQIQDSHGTQTGGGMATAGLVLGIIGLGIAAILIIAAVAATDDPYRY